MGIYKITVSKSLGAWGVVSNRENAKRRREWIERRSSRSCGRATVRHREMETSQMETSLIRASVSLRKIETDLLGSWWP